MDEILKVTDTGRLKQTKELLHVTQDQLVDKSQQLEQMTNLALRLNQEVIMLKEKIKKSAPKVYKELYGTEKEEEKTND